MERHAAKAEAETRREKRPAGTVLFPFMFILLLAVYCGIGWLGYRNGLKDGGCYPGNLLGPLVVLFLPVQIMQLRRICDRTGRVGSYVSFILMFLFNADICVYQSALVLGASTVRGWRGRAMSDLQTIAKGVETYAADRGG